LKREQDEKAAHEEAALSDGIGEGCGKSEDSSRGSVSDEAKDDAYAQAEESVIGKV
jgi:hypothetical protein